MVGEVSIQVGIDAEPAKTGAREFERSAKDIIRSAENIRRSVEKTGDSLKRFSQDTTRHSRTFVRAVSNARRGDGLAQLVAENDKNEMTKGSDGISRRPEIFRRLEDKSSRTIEELKTMLDKAAFDRLTRSGNSKEHTHPPGLTHDPIDFVLGLFAGATDNIKLESKQNREFKERSELADRFISEAKNLLKAGDRVGAQERNNQAARLLEVNLESKKDDLSQLYKKVELQVREMSRIFGSPVKDNPFNPNPKPRSPMFGSVRAALEAYMEQVETLEKEIADRRKKVTSLRNTVEGSTQGEEERSVPAPEILSPQSDDTDDRLKQQIDDTTRSIELLKEQNRALEDNAAGAATQKEAELELCQREMECLERLNKALQENQSLRGSTGGQSGGYSDDALEGAAAYDGLSTAIEQNVEAAKGLKDQVDSLNTVLQSNAGINAQIVGGLAQERDARRQVNDTVAERRQLEQDQGQRLIAEQKDVSDSAAEVDAAITQIKNAAKDAFRDVIKGTESVGDAFRKLADRITDILLDLALDELLKGGTGFSDLFNVVFGGIGSIFGGGNAAAFTGGAPGAATVGGLLKLPHGSPFHAGGVVGRDGGLPRPIAANVNSLPRFHAGGVTGLAPDEVPIIARRGEEVLTRGDPRHRDNAGAGGVVVNVTFPNARNTDEARQAGSEIAAKAAAAAQRGMARKGLG